MSDTGLMKKMRGSSASSRIRDTRNRIFPLSLKTNMDVASILRKASRNWDGGYAMTGMIGHGDAFVMRDPAGIQTGLLLY